MKIPFTCLAVLAAFSLLTCPAMAQNTPDTEGSADAAMEALFGTSGEFEQGQSNRPDNYTGIVQHGSPAAYRQTYMYIEIDLDNLDVILADLGISDDQIAIDAFILVMMRHETKHHGVYKIDASDSEEERLCKHLANFVDDHSFICTKLDAANVSTAIADANYRNCAIQYPAPAPECDSLLEIVLDGNSLIEGLCKGLQYNSAQIEDLIVTNQTCTPYDVSDWQGPYTWYPAPVDFGPVAPCGNCFPY